MALTAAQLDDLERHANKRTHLDPVFQEVPVDCKELLALITMARGALVLKNALEFYANRKHYACWCYDENLDAEDAIRHEHEWKFEDGKEAREALTQYDALTKGSAE